LGIQSQLWRVLIRVNAGRYAEAGPKLLAIEQNALRMQDTLTALEAVYARSGTALRIEGANASLAIMMRGDSLNWRRDPMLDGNARCRLSLLYSRLGNRERARALAREGMAIANSARLPRLAASCQFSLATEFARSGLTDSLRVPLQTAIATQEKTGDLAGLAASKQWAGYYLLSLGKMPQAQAQLIGAWAASEHAKSVNTSAWIALNRAGLASVFYDAVGSNMWLTRADSLMRSVDDLQGQIEVLKMRATQAQRAGDIATTERLLREAQVATDRLGEPGAGISISAERYELAMHESKIDEAAAIAAERRAMVDRYHLTGFITTLLTEDAEIALRRGQPDMALTLLDQVATGIHPTQMKFLFAIGEQRALALSQRGNARAAATAALSAAETFDKWRASLNDEALQTLSVQSRASDAWVSSTLTANLASSGEEEVAFSLSERRRARDLRDRLALAATFGKGSATAVDSSVQTTFSVSELQRLLPDQQTAIVMMNLGEGGARGTAFVLTKRALTAHPLPTVDDIAPRVRRLVALLEAGRDASVESRALGAALIAPLIARLDSAGTTRLVFLPEGVLHRLPFDVLRLPDGRFLIERFETAVAPSATVLMRLAAQPREQTGAPRVLAFADARSKQTKGDDSTGDSPFFMTLFRGATLMPSLRGAQAEVAEIQRVFSRTVTRTGLRATETEMKRESGSYDILHFATHAVVDEWSGSSAALALTPSATDDGLLNSDEIAHLKLHASLVLLSACRTVGGEVIAGEGVRGLTSAFLQAGARSVIATGWRVNDRDVVPVVSAIYQELARRRPVGAALRSAQLAAIRRKTSPTVWAAFSLVGDPWRVVTGAP
ncbi:MAG: CHAT domain-containing protein, partial [Gemmatimonas sp.]